MVTRLQLQTLSSRIDELTQALEGEPENSTSVHLHFDNKTDDEFLAEVAEKDPEAIWHPWLRLDLDGASKKQRDREFAAALKRARTAQNAAGKTPEKFASMFRR
jgi:hypothetical protein